MASVRIGASSIRPSSPATLSGWGCFPGFLGAGAAGQNGKRDPSAAVILVMSAIPVKALSSDFAVPDNLDDGPRKAPSGAGRVRSTMIAGSIHVGAVMRWKTAPKRCSALVPFRASRFKSELVRLLQSWLVSNSCYGRVQLQSGHGIRRKVCRQSNGCWNERRSPCSRIAGQGLVGADRRSSPFILRRERLLSRHSPVHPRSYQQPPGDRAGPLCSRYRPR
ncbi:hypothetical protein ACVIN2_002861 [Bradyrhizobium sp. USDA 3650]